MILVNLSIPNYLWNADTVFLFILLTERLRGLKVDSSGELNDSGSIVDGSSQINNQIYRDLLQPVGEI